MPTEQEPKGERGPAVDTARLAAARARLVGVEQADRRAGLLADPLRPRVLHPLDLVDGLRAGDIALALDRTEDPVGDGPRLLHTPGPVSTREQGGVVCRRPAEGFLQSLREHRLPFPVELSCRPPEEDPS